MAVKQGTGKNKILLWIKAGSGICSIKWGGSIKKPQSPCELGALRLADRGVQFTTRTTPKNTGRAEQDMITDEKIAAVRRQPRL